MPLKVVANDQSFLKIWIQVILDHLRLANLFPWIIRLIFGEDYHERIAMAHEIHIFQVPAGDVKLDFGG
jgi:hypothetical protein